ncbi:cytidylyltransferase domain-containing protein [Bacillus sp. SCS-151]|uniref:cytidylyltransferase domain-containing protein n=1 Tax=Nanhaiella sioensis TaxID=3115293 RepID=UPI00397870B5
MEILIIIQARMGSTRLPGKVLKPLGASTVINYVVSRCKQIQKTLGIIVATSTLKQDDQIEEWCKKHDITCYRGSESDVLSRYYHCAKQYNPDYVIRVTADCPFIDYNFANQIINRMEKNPADIVIVHGHLPRGLVVEMIAFAALEFIYKYGYETRHREHVTYYAYEHPSKFKHTKVIAPSFLNHPELRITLDTIEDYQMCCVVADYFKGEILIPSRDVVEYLVTHANVANMNAHITQKPVE